MSRNFSSFVLCLVFFVSFISINLVSKVFLCAIFFSLMSFSFLLIKKYLGCAITNNLLFVSIVSSCVLSYYLIPSGVFSSYFILFSLLSLYCSINIISKLQDFFVFKSSSIMFFPFLVFCMSLLDTLFMSQIFFFFEKFSVNWILKKLFLEEMFYRITLQFLLFTILQIRVRFQSSYRRYIV